GDIAKTLSLPPDDPEDTTTPKKPSTTEESPREAQIQGDDTSEEAQEQKVDAFDVLVEKAESGEEIPEKPDALESTAETTESTTETGAVPETTTGEAPTPGEKISETPAEETQETTDELEEDIQEDMAGDTKQKKIGFLANLKTRLSYVLSRSKKPTEELPEAYSDASMMLDGDTASETETLDAPDTAASEAPAGDAPVEEQAPVSPDEETATVDPSEEVLEPGGEEEILPSDEEALLSEQELAALVAPKKAPIVKIVKAIDLSGLFSVLSMLALLVVAGFITYSLYGLYLESSKINTTYAMAEKAALDGRLEDAHELIITYSDTLKTQDAKNESLTLTVAGWAAALRKNNDFEAEQKLIVAFNKCGITSPALKDALSTSQMAASAVHFKTGDAESAASLLNSAWTALDSSGRDSAAISGKKRIMAKQAYVIYSQSISDCLRKKDTITAFKNLKSLERYAVYVPLKESKIIAGISDKTVALLEQQANSNLKKNNAGKAADLAKKALALNPKSRVAAIYFIRNAAVYLFSVLIRRVSGLTRVPPPN
ncbi:MAG: hypothetical protein KAG97_10175, partial [Victivallales bacterium]|nr:hypothetical protein [Victivallales bacterium]